MAILIKYLFYVGNYYNKMTILLYDGNISSEQSVLQKYNFYFENVCIVMTISENYWFN